MQLNTNTKIPKLDDRHLVLAMKSARKKILEVTILSLMAK